jgi:hypothetical protein
MKLSIGFGMISQPTTTYYQLNATLRSHIHLTSPYAVLVVDVGLVLDQILNHGNSSGARICNQTRYSAGLYTKTLHNHICLTYTGARKHRGFRAERVRKTYMDFHIDGDIGQIVGNALDIAGITRVCELGEVVGGAGEAQGGAGGKHGHGAEQGGWLHCWKGVVENTHATSHILARLEPPHTHPHPNTPSSTRSCSASR